MGYPKCKYFDPNNHEDFVIVKSKAAEDALGPKWKDHWQDCVEPEPVAEKRQRKQREP